MPNKQNPISLDEYEKRLSELERQAKDINLKWRALQNLAKNINTLHAEVYMRIEAILVQNERFKKMKPVKVHDEQHLLSPLWKIVRRVHIMGFDVQMILDKKIGLKK